MLINLDCTGLPLDNLSTNAHFKGAVMPEDKNERGFFKGLAMLASMGIAMVVSTFIGLIIGIYLDKYFDTKPWLTIIFLVLGIAAGFRNIYEMTRKYGFK